MLDFLGAGKAGATQTRRLLYTVAVVFVASTLLDLFGGPPLLVRKKTKRELGEEAVNEETGEIDFSKILPNSVFYFGFGLNVADMERSERFYGDPW